MTGLPSVLSHFSIFVSHKGAYQILPETVGASFRQPAISGNEIIGEVANDGSKAQSEANDGAGDARVDYSAESDGDETWDGVEKDYPEETLLPIRRQIEYYFSA